MAGQHKRKYSPEFKREALELANQPGQTVVGVAANLGIGAGLIHRWRRENAAHGHQAFVGQGVARDEEMLALRSVFTPLAIASSSSAKS